MACQLWPPSVEGQRLHPLFGPLFDNIVAVMHRSRCFIDIVEDILINGFFIVEKFAGLAIELPENSRLADGEQQFLSAESTSTRS